MKIAIVTDAWEPQVNGVVNATRNVCKVLESQGLDVLVISPSDFRNFPCPTYPEIRLAAATPARIGAKLDKLDPDAIHIMTEGPIGLCSRRWCLKRKIPFTTAYCTNFPEYVSKRTHLPASVFWPYFRWFHGKAEKVYTSTNSLRALLRENRIDHTHHWGRGVDLANFTTDAPPPEIFSKLERPILIFVGRVAVEKNIEAFLRLTNSGSKVVIGDGPARTDLQSRFPDAVFLGKKVGRELAGCYAGADVLVFPSVTDTFGVVMIEALACGTPVAAYPANGAIDVVTDEVGCLDHDLHAAVAHALNKDRQTCADYGRKFSWDESARQFLNGLACLEKPV